MKKMVISWQGNLAVAIASFALATGLVFAALAAAPVSALADDAASSSSSSAAVKAPAPAPAPAKSGWNSAKTKYYVKGVPVTGAKKISGKWRAFDKNGKLMKKAFKLQGVKYYPTAKGILRARYAKGSWYYNNGNKMTKADALDFKCLLYAEKLVPKLTKKSDSKATKRYKCFKFISMKAYVMHRGFSYNRVGWPAIYAMDQLSGKGGDCVSDAAAFAYLAAAIGYKGVYLCTDTMATYSDPHSWVMINGRIYDTLFARAKGWDGNYNATGSYRMNPTQRFAIPQYSPSHAKKAAAAKKSTKKQGLKKEKGAYYFYKDGKKLRSSWKTVKGKRYYFKSNSKAAVKSCKVGKTYYVFNTKGQLKTGTQTRVVKIDGVKYQVTKTGKAKSGWSPGHKYLYSKKGARIMGSCMAGGKWFYLSATKGVYSKEKTAELRKLAKYGASGKDLVALLGKPSKTNRVESCITFNEESGDDVLYTYPHMLVQTFIVTQEGVEDQGVEYVYNVTVR